MLETVNQPTVVQLLCLAIAALVAAIVWLALYIRRLHKDAMKDKMEMHKDLKEIAKEQIESQKDMKTAVRECSIAVRNNTKATDDLHKLILQRVVK